MIAGGEGQMQRDYWYDVNRIGTQLTDAQFIGRRAAERTVNRLGARPVPTCEVPVLFAAELATGLFSSFLSAISGGNLYRKSSFLEDALGQRLFPEWLSIDERPLIPRAMASASFDNDGLATYAKPFVEKGELVSYILGTYSGRKLGLPSTANAGGVHNLFVTHGQEDQKALLRRMDRGLLVTELMGHGLNMVTGDYSWRGRLLGGERRDPVPRPGSHHRGQHEGHVPADPGGGQRSRSTRQHPHRLGADRAHDGGGQLTAAPFRKRALVARFCSAAFAFLPPFARRRAKAPVSDFLRLMRIACVGRICAGSPSG